MLFNSIDFVIFLPIVFLLYWFGTRNNFKLQNVLMVIASYFFYGWWDWRFLSLILFSTLVDFTVGLSLSNTIKKRRRKLLLWTSIIVNIGFLVFFKYYNFFLDNFIEAFTFFGLEIKASSLNIILPVGISFYTFQTLSYTVDVYKNKIGATRDFFAFAAFVSFFPQLVAGPIERASNLLPQFLKERKFVYSDAVDGLRQILWGFFKKVVIADNCAHFVDVIFSNSAHYGGSTLLLGAVFFTFQIYGDFSGYSDIAIGTAKLFGIKLMRNFAYPYFSRDIAEFWRRWHISLSTWFRDYLYIPLGGSKGGKWMQIRNTFIIFIVSGFWHGANWTFIVWGALNAMYFLPLLLTGKNRKNIEIVAKNSYLPSLRDFLGILFTFILTVFAWIFFRAADLTHALQYISSIFTESLFSEPHFQGYKTARILYYLIPFLVIIEWVGRKNLFAIEKIGLQWKRPYRLIFYAFIVFLIGVLMKTNETPFIYFQF